MKLKEAKEQFIETWGALGSQWGINRTMSSIHALLITSDIPLSTEDIMEQLKISRGNVNMNIRALMDWGLVKKKMITGERKDFFFSDKDVWDIARQIANERRKRELQPVIEMMPSLLNVEENTEEAKKFKSVITELQDFTERVDDTLDKFAKSDKNWFYKTLMKLIR